MVPEFWRWPPCAERKSFQPLDRFLVHRLCEPGKRLTLPMKIQSPSLVAVEGNQDYQTREIHHLLDSSHEESSWMIWQQSWGKFQSQVHSWHRQSQVCSVLALVPPRQSIRKSSPQRRDSFFHGLSTSTRNVCQDCGNVGARHDIGRHDNAQKHENGSHHECLCKSNKV